MNISLEKFYHKACQNHSSREAPSDAIKAVFSVILFALFFLKSYKLFFKVIHEEFHSLSLSLVKNPVMGHPEISLQKNNLLKDSSCFSPIGLIRCEPEAFTFSQHDTSEESERKGFEKYPLMQHLLEEAKEKHPQISLTSDGLTLALLINAKKKLMHLGGLINISEEGIKIDLPNDVLKELLSPLKESEV